MQADSLPSELRGKLCPGLDSGQRQQVGAIYSPRSRLGAPLACFLSALGATSPLVRKMQITVLSVMSGCVTQDKSPRFPDPCFLRCEVSEERRCFSIKGFCHDGLWEMKGERRVDPGLRVKLGFPGSSAAKNPPAMQERQETQI